MPRIPQIEPPDAVWLKLVKHLILWALIIGVEVEARWLLVAHGSKIGLSSGQLSGLESYLGWVVAATLLATATSIAGEVIAVGTRHLLDELILVADRIEALLCRIRRIAQRGTNTND